jgi:hypothetical protein
VGRETTVGRDGHWHGRTLAETALPPQQTPLQTCSSSEEVAGSSPHWHKRRLTNSWSGFVLVWVLESTLLHWQRRTSSPR